MLGNALRRRRERPVGIRFPYRSPCRIMERGTRRVACRCPRPALPAQKEKRMSFRTRTLFVLLLAACFTPSARCEDRLINGDFESSGPVGSNNYGPFWSGNSGATVFGPGWEEGVSPYSGSKAVGVVVEGRDASGLLSQTVTVAAGTYSISFAGFAWLYTGPGSPFNKSQLTVTLRVDGKIIRRLRLINHQDTPDKTWTPAMIQWTGPVSGTVRVDVNCQADGRAGVKAVSATDAWALDISPPRAPRPNLLTNGGFELCGNYGSHSASPGWYADPAWEVAGIEYNGMAQAQASPLSGVKMLGISAYEVVKNYAVGQFVTMTPGYRALVFRGSFWAWDENPADGDFSSFDIVFSVDGAPVYSRHLGVNLDFRDSEWTPIEFLWAGNVNQAVSVVVRADVRAHNAGSWAASAIDEWLVAEVDTSPPPAPLVMDDGPVTGSTTQIHASWSVADPQSGVENCQFSIGTSPGATDITPWMNVGQSRSITKTGLSLPLGTTCYFNVRAQNGMGAYGPVGSSDGITVTVPSQYTIPQAKDRPDGSVVLIADRAVSARVGTEIWIQEPDRGSGIRVRPAHAYAIIPGSRVAVSGFMATENGERIVDHAEAWQTGTGPVPRPLLLSSPAVGGDSAGPMVPAVSGSLGPHNVGQPGKVWGRITAIGQGYYYVDDGGGLRDGSATGPSANVGVRIVGSPGALVAGDLVLVSGPVSTFQDGGVHPCLIQVSGGITKLL